MNQLTPRLRRLASDYQSLLQLAATSSAFSFEVSYRGEMDLPEAYVVHFHGSSLLREGGSLQTTIGIREEHQVRIQLGPQYPRLMPSLQWITPIFHPNISSSGTVCLGGYSSFWVPSLKLDQLCEMMWDMLTFRNYNLASPYNRDAAQWMTQQKSFAFPLESHSLRHSTRKSGSLITDESPQAKFSNDSIGDDEIQFLE